MKSKIRAARFILIPLILSVTSLCSLLSLAAYIGDYDHQSHVITNEDAEVSLVENYDDDQAFIYGSTTLDYSTGLQSSATTDVYVFVEFDSPIISGSPLLTPEPGSGWVLYDEDTTEIEEQTLHRYIFAYCNGSKMTKLSSGIKLENVISSVSVMSNLSEAQFTSLRDNPFHIVARSVVASADGNGDPETCWSMVPNDY